LVRLKIDLIVVSGRPTALAAKNATTTIPIVMTNVGDPVGGTAEGLPLAIETLETASAYSRQVFQRVARRDSSARKCVLDALAKMIEGHVGGHNHECLTELDEQDLTPFERL
jgi:hypothetical protein